MKKVRKKLSLNVERISVLNVDDSSQVYGGAKPPKTKKKRGCQPATVNDQTCVTCIVDTYCGC